MRVRKVDLDAIKLYELSQVKFKTTGTIREVQFSAGVNKSCAIQNISKDTYLDKTTGEIKKRKHNTNRFQAPKSVRKSINRLMDLIRCSFRKGFATNVYVNNHYNIELVRTLLQHSSVNVTQRYIGIGSQELEEAIQKNVCLG